MSNIAEGFEAEGFEREGNKEFRQFLSVAKGSAGEVRANSTSLSTPAIYRRMSSKDSPLKPGKLVG